jgi:hypothetical protein
MTTKTLSKEDLQQFTGSETFYRHALNRKVVFTEGAHHVAEAGWTTSRRIGSCTKRPSSLSRRCIRDIASG